MSKEDLVRFSASVDWELLKEFDNVIQKEGYGNRSFATRALFREFIMSAKSKTGDNIGGLFVIISIVQDNISDLCDQYFYVKIPTMSGKSLCFCIIEDKENVAREKFRQFNLNPDVEYCKFITMEIN